MQPAPLGAATVVTRSSPAGMHQQHHIHPSNTYILAAPGHHAPVQQPGTSRTSFIQTSAGVKPIDPYIPQTKPHQHGTVIATLPIFPPAPLVPREYAPATWAGTAGGRRPWCPPCRQTRLPAPGRIRVLLQAPFSLRK